MMAKNNIVKYNNGNYTVMLNLKDGTMIRYTDDDELRPKFPDSMDIKITNCCFKGCKYCHERSTNVGHHADLFAQSFIDTLHPYTQIALGGGDVLTHPDLERFLYKCKVLKLVPSITINQTHFMANRKCLHKLVDRGLIYGIGISLTNVSDILISALKEFPNIVLHTIVGIVTAEQLRQLAHNDLKVLFLGYKIFGRGEDYWAENKHRIVENENEFEDLLPQTIHEQWFKNISFDNLALERINVKRVLSPEEWKMFYMGEDGRSTMYIDMVERQFAASSTSSIRHSLEDNVEDMLKIIHQEKGLDIE